MKTALYIKSNGLKGNKLFNFVLDKVNKLKETEVNNFDQVISIEEIELVIDGNEWMWEMNSKLQLTGMSYKELQIK